jgi:hypothetical protein
MNFWFSFILTALIGTTVVYHVSPTVWKYYGESKPVAISKPAATPAAAPALVAAPAPVATPAPAASLPTKTTPSVSVMHTIKPAKTEPAPVVAAASSEKPAPVPVNPEATTTTAASSSPAPASAAIAPSGATNWGLTITCANYYSLSGENRGTLPGGALMDISSHRSSSRGDMAAGDVERNSAMVGPYLVAASDLVQFDVPRSTLPVETVNTLRAYYSLKGRLDQRIADLKAKDEDANPCVAAYRAAYKEYNAFGTETEALRAKFDQASGSLRQTYEDRLRTMKPESVRLRQALDAAKIKYMDWKKNHPAPPATDPSKDSQVKDLQAQIAALEPKVKEIMQ